MKNSTFKKYKIETVFENLFIIPIVLFVIFIALKAAPVTDDYCLAYASKIMGPLEAGIDLNKSWSPALPYFLNLFFWSVPASALFVASLQTLTSSIIFLLGFFVFFSQVFTFLGVVNGKRKSLLVSIGMITSISISQTSIFFNSVVVKTHNPISAIKDWGDNFFLSPRDGQMLQWIFAVPMIFTKIAIMVLTFFTLIFFLKKEIQGKKFSIYSSSFLVFFSLMGLSTEPMIAVLYISLLVIRKAMNNYRHAIVLIIPLISYYLQIKSPGAKIRNSILVENGAGIYVYRFLGISLEFLFLLLLVSVVAFVFSKYLRFNMKLIPHKKYSLLCKHFFLMFIAVLIVEMFVEVYAYPAAYHWIALITVSFSYFFFSFQKINYCGNKMVIHILFTSLLLISLVSLVNTFQTVDNRNQLWKQRSNNSLSDLGAIKQQLPVVDNLNTVIAFDNDPNAASIVAGKGYIVNFTYYCLSKLPPGW